MTYDDDELYPYTFKFEDTKDKELLNYSYFPGGQNYMMTFRDEHGDMLSLRVPKEYAIPIIKFHLLEELGEEVQ